MSKARDLINAHLYPVLTTFAVVYGAIQIAPIAQQARDIEMCAKIRANILMAKKVAEGSRFKSGSDVLSYCYELQQF